MIPVKKHVATLGRKNSLLIGTHLIQNKRIYSVWQELGHDKINVVIPTQNMTAGHAEQPKDLGLCLLGWCVFFFLLSNKLFRFSVFLALLWTFDVFNSAAPGESESKVNPAVGSAVNRSGSSGRPTEYKPSPELERRNYRLPHTSNLILFTQPTNPDLYPGEGGNPDVVLRSLVLLLIPSPGWEWCCACTAKINMTEHKA